MFSLRMHASYLAVVQNTEKNHCSVSSHCQFENEMITKLDMLIEGGRGDEQYMELFRET